MKTETSSTNSSSSINLIALLISSAMIGVLVGLVSAAFLRFLDWSTHLLWQELPHQIAPQGSPTAYTLIICTLGGLIVGVCQKYLGNHPPSLQETLQEFRKTGRIEYKHLPNGIVNVLASLVFGGSLGPEAGLTDMIGGLATWFGDFRARHHYVRRALTYAAVSAGLAFLGSPIGGAFLTSESSEDEILPPFPKFLPALVGACAGFGGFIWFMGYTLGGFSHLPSPTERQPVNLLLAIPVALVGAAAGLGYHFSSLFLKKFFSPLAQQPVLRGLFGGLGLGILGSFLPLTLFSGEHDFRFLVEQGAQLGFAVLFLTGLAKMFANALCLTTGWKGGIIFPLIFSGASLGLACSVLFPVIPPIVGVAGGMAATTVTILRQPLAVIVIALGIMRAETAGVIVVATLVGYTLTQPFFPPRKTHVVSEKIASASQPNQ